MKRTCTAAVVALALAAAGCAGDDSDQFREDYNAAVERLASISTDIGSAAATQGDQTNAQIAREFREIAATAEQTRSDLAGLDPPEGAQEEFDGLLAALEQGVRNLRSVARAARSNDPQAADRAARKLTRSGDEITRAENALKRAIDG